MTHLERKLLRFCPSLVTSLLVGIDLKVVSAAFLLVCFLSRKESTCETRKNVFYFTFKSSFRSGENQILDILVS